MFTKQNTVCFVINTLIKLSIEFSNLVNLSPPKMFCFGKDSFLWASGDTIQKDYRFQSPYVRLYPKTKEKMVK